MPFVGLGKRKRPSHQATYPLTQNIVETLKALLG